MYDALRPDLCLAVGVGLQGINHKRGMVTKMQKQTKKQKILSLISNMFILIAGNALYASATVFFIMPSGLVMGGVTGVSILVQSFFPNIEVSYLIFALNVVLFVWGAIVLGRHFVVTTGASTLLYPLFVNIFERVSRHFDFDMNKFMSSESDMILFSLAAGLIIGVAVGIVVRIGASTGGSDIPPLVFNKLFGLPMGAGMLLVDGTIILAQFIAYLDLSRVLYGVVMVMIYSYVINQVSVMGSGKVEVSVVSDQYDEIRATIMSELGRGITLLSARKGMTGAHCKMVMTVVSTRQLARVKKIVLGIDPSAFMVITRVSEVNGNGFSFSKGDKKLDKSELLK